LQGVETERIDYYEEHRDVFDTAARLDERKAEVRNDIKALVAARPSQTFDGDTWNATLTTSTTRVKMASIEHVVKAAASAAVSSGRFTSEIAARQFAEEVGVAVMNILPMKTSSRFTIRRKRVAAPRSDSRKRKAPVGKRRRFTR
jgi:hypothetical protein